MALPLNQREQERAVLAARFTDGRDVDRRIILDGALVLTYATTDALDGIDVWAFELDRRTPAVGHFDVACEDCLRADRAYLFADHATGVHRPGETSALVVKCGPGLDWTFGLERSDTQLLDDRDLADRPRRANLAAEGAVELAPSHLRDHDRGPEPFESCLKQSRLQHIGWANANTLVALDTAPEKFILGNRTGGSNHASLEVLAYAA